MFTPYTSTKLRGIQNAVNRAQPHVKRYLRLTFIRGPKQLLTSRISAKCAAIIVAMCTPSLLFCGMLTIPAMIFQSPQQNAYFHFSQVLERDPTRWVVLILAGMCALMSLAVPATLPEPKKTSLY
jgi:hypothetical protein